MTFGGATRRCRVATAALLVATLMALPIEQAAAGEAGPEATARAHFRRAEADYAAGRYAVALEGYQAGYDASPLPGFLVNIAQCQRRLGDLARARATYSRFIMVAPDSPLVPEVTKLIAELDRLLAESQSAENMRPSPGPDDVVAPGASATAGSATSPPPASRPAAGNPAPATLTLPAPASAPPRHVDEPGKDSSDASATAAPRRWWLWGGVALAVAGAATAVILLSNRDPDTVHEGSLGTLRR